MKEPVLYQQPNSWTHISIPVLVVQPVPTGISGPAPMEVDDIVTKKDRYNPFPAIRSVFIQNNLCFCCLQSFDLKAHMLNGEQHWPNKNLTSSEKLVLISNQHGKKKQNKQVHQIAALTVEENTNQ